RLLTGLDFAVRGDRADLQCVIAWLGVPLVDPLAPRVGARDVGQAGRLPRTVVDADLYALDAAVLCPGHAGDGDRACGDVVAGSRDVDPRGDFHRAPLSPAAGRPVRLERVEPAHLEVDHPLGGADVAVQARHDHPHREPVLEGQRL